MLFGQLFLTNDSLACVPAHTYVYTYLCMYIQHCSIYPQLRSIPVFLNTEARLKSCVYQLWDTDSFWKSTSESCSVSWWKEAPDTLSPDSSALNKMSSCPLQKGFYYRHEGNYQAMREERREKREWKRRKSNKREGPSGPRERRTKKVCDRNGRVI